MTVQQLLIALVQTAPLTIDFEVEVDPLYTGFPRALELDDLKVDIERQKVYIAAEGK